MQHHVFVNLSQLVGKMYNIYKVWGSNLDQHKKNRRNFVRMLQVDSEDS